MSNTDIAKSLIDQIPEETPNNETLESFDELDDPEWHTFTGSTKDLFSELTDD